MLKEVLNPFSEDALKIVKQAPPLNKLSPTIFDHALKKISPHPPAEAIAPSDQKEDVLSFHLLFAACASRFAPASQEARFVIEITKRIIRGRIGWLLKDTFHREGYDQDMVARAFSQFFPVTKVDIEALEEDVAKDLRLASKSLEPEDLLQYKSPVLAVMPALEKGKNRLTDLYINKGEVYLSLRSLRSLAMALLEVSIRKHMERIAKRRERIAELDPLADAISKATREPEYLESYRKRVYTIIPDRAKGSPLKPQYFPPCIQHTLQGVSSGSRNYAITVLLTSFISYARIAPTGSAKDAKLSDYLKDTRILEEEILSLIFDAADRCTPPLFADQPLEKMNIFYHLGLGMTQEVNLEHAGRSSWYFPPNCDKIKREAPNLCHPDKDCSEVKNPLSYYTRKLFAERKKVKAKDAKTKQPSSETRV